MFDLPALRTADLIQFLIAGLTNGSIYALVALGYHIIYLATRVINFAQGEAVVIGGLLALTLLSGVGLPFAVAFLLAILLSGVIGFVLEKLAVRPVYRAGELAAIIVTIGAMIVLRNGHQAIWGSQSRAFPQFGGDLPFSLLTPVFAGASTVLFQATGAGFSPTFVWIVLLSLVAVVLTRLFFQRTLFGKAIRATADNPLASESVGINTHSVTAVAFAISLALAGAAGILAGPLLFAGGAFGVEIGLKGFAAAVIGGLASPVGVVVGGYIVGVIESFSGGLISPQYKEVIAFGVMFLGLLVRPTGLFGEKRVSRA